ncbi:MAG TPA: hypothetical protein VF587_11310 [Solirubrobacteraceae bacterium]|jgi:hypothetical protein
MESQERQDETQGDEDQQEFVEQVENDPSTASSDGDADDLEEVRGG